ncbi:alpha/beta-hydrolase [Cubamyces lactineus]|nr:alpha/beta-hydrolase [Cubamyces lactineus]
MGNIIDINKQPWTTFYLAYYVAALVFGRWPYWTIKYIPRSNRPRQAWTLTRCLIVKTFQYLFSCPVDISPGATSPAPTIIPDSQLSGAKSNWVEPIPNELFTGEIRRYAEITGVQPVRVPGYWLLKKGYNWTGPKAKPGEKTLLHLHGGAFTLGSAQPSDTTANLTRGLLQYSEKLQRTFAVDYRLSVAPPAPPTNPFPAAVLDGLAGYWYLVHEAGFEPQNIILAGDSAGGNMVVAIVRHLLENPVPTLPLPGHLLTASTVLDLAMTHDGPESSAILNAPTDIFDIPPPGVVFALDSVEAYLGPLPFEEAKTNRYISPVSRFVKPGPEGLFKGFPSTFVVAGGAERLEDDSREFIAGLKRDGSHVIHEIPPDAVHDLLVWTWHNPERIEVLQKIARWIDDMP